MLMQLSLARSLWSCMMQVDEQACLVDHSCVSLLSWLIISDAGMQQMAADDAWILTGNPDQEPHAA